MCQEEREIEREEERGKGTAERECEHERERRPRRREDMRRIEAGMGWSEYSWRFTWKSEGNSWEGKGEQKKREGKEGRFWNGHMASIDWGAFK